MIVAIFELAVGLEEVDDRQVADGFPVRDGAGLEDEPTLDAVGVRELVEQARLAHPRLPYQRHHLSLTGERQLLGADKMREFGVSSNESREAPRRRRLEPGSCRPGSGQLID